MTRLPISKEQHWTLLNEDPESSKFQRVENEAIIRIEQLFGLQVDGHIEEVNNKSYGVGFDLSCSMNKSSNSRVRRIFPSDNDNLSYWVKASEIPLTDDHKTIEVFKTDFSFNHQFRVDQSVLPIVLERFRSNGIFIDSVKESQRHTMKKISTSESYINSISSSMEVWDDLHKPSDKNYDDSSQHI